MDRFGRACRRDTLQIHVGRKDSGTLPATEGLSNTSIGAHEFGWKCSACGWIGPLYDAKIPPRYWRKDHACM